MDSAKIFIDTDNEITFIIEKILNAKSERVCLVVPDRASIFTSISTLKLLKRVIDKSNKLLILVTLDDNGVKLAQRVGFVVVRRLGEVNGESWEKVQKQKFELLKKNKSKIYYTPEIPELDTSATDENTEDNSEKANVSISDIESSDLVGLDYTAADTTIASGTPQLTIDLPSNDLRRPVVEQVTTKSINEERTRSQGDNNENTDQIFSFMLSHEQISGNTQPQTLSQGPHTPPKRRRKSKHKTNNLEFFEGKDLLKNARDI
jgi:hypothetical protein